MLYTIKPWLSLFMFHPWCAILTGRRPRRYYYANATAFELRPFSTGGHCREDLWHRIDTHWEKCCYETQCLKSRSHFTTLRAAKQASIISLPINRWFLTFFTLRNETFLLISKHCGSAAPLTRRGCWGWRVKGVSSSEGRFKVSKKAIAHWAFYNPPDARFQEVLLLL